MRDIVPHSRLARWLISYYGLVEVAHAAVLTLAGVRLLRSGTLGFPGTPPPGGWASQTMPFLIALGAVDALNVLLAWTFVYGYWRGARWCWGAGGVSLGMMACSALVYVVGTGAAGAWASDPWGYLAVTLVFAPLLPLMVLYGLWVARGQVG